MDADTGYVLTDGARLYYRAVGGGPPIVVLHGGPEFNHHYLLPELDRLADAFRLVYYDQRGRGRSAGRVLGIDSEVEDLEAVRRHFGWESLAVLGHSWGAVLAMEYATRHPDRVSRLILLNPAPASAADAASLREHLRRIRRVEDVERMSELAASPRYQAGDLETETEYCRIHFRAAVPTPELVERVVGRLWTHFDEEGVLAARAIDELLSAQTFGSAGYDLVPRLQTLHVPSLVLHGEHDFIPVALAARIAEAMPRARLVVLPGVGHFSYLEAPDAVHREVTDLFES